jgi:DNA-directed RNA polymerase subunit L
VPSYGISTDNIFIEKNTSIYDNDIMRSRISMLPIPKMMNDVDYYNNYNNNNDDNKSDKQIDIYLNVINDTKDIMNVTTNDYKVLVNGGEVKNPYDQEKPSLVIRLKPEQEFSFRAVAEIGIAKNHDLWAVASPCYYKELEEDNYEFIFETLGQMTHKEILTKACTVVIKKLENIENMIKSNYNDPSLDKVKKIYLTLENENHTMGNLITYALQDQKNVLYAGFKKDHLLIDEINIRLETTTYNPLKTFFETTTKLKGVFMDTKNNITKLNYKK